MTDLQVRKMRFAFADYDVPFVWNEANPAFSSMANAVSFLAIGFEKMIVNMIREAMPRITDRAIAEEADAFVRQEGQHSTAHRQHANALIRRFPGLQETLNDVIAEFDRLTVNTSLEYRLAYTADLEATFTPVFKLMLDNDSSSSSPETTGSRRCSSGTSSRKSNIEVPRSSFSSPLSEATPTGCVWHRRYSGT